MPTLHQIKYLKVKTVWIFLASTLLIFSGLGLYLYFRPYQFSGAGVVLTAAFSKEPLEKKIENKFANGIVLREKIYALRSPERSYYLYISEVKEKVLLTFSEGVLLNRYINQLTLMPGMGQTIRQPSFYDDYAGISLLYATTKNILSGQVYLTPKAIVGIFVIENGNTTSAEASSFINSLSIREATQLSDVF